jgi:c-di-GMP phosphodiesterase
LSGGRDFDVSSLKIDKPFVNRITIVYIGSAITVDIISISHRLGHGVVAEGAESEVQKEYLLLKDRDCIQGYVFCKPLSTYDTLAFARLYASQAGKRKTWDT